MARLRASWRTSLPVVQQPRNPQSESIARSPYKILVSEGWCGRTTLHPRGLPAWITRQLAWTGTETGCDAVGQRRPACSRHQHRSEGRLGPLPAAVGDRNALRGHQDAGLQFRGYPPDSPRPDRQASGWVGRGFCVRPRDRGRAGETPAHPPERLPTTQQLVKESCTVGCDNRWAWLVRCVRLGDGASAAFFWLLSGSG